MTIQIPVDAPLGPANVIVNPATGDSCRAGFDHTQPVRSAIDQLHYRQCDLADASKLRRCGDVLNPALPNETIVVYAIGLGPTSPVSSTGPSSASTPTATPPTVSLNGPQNPIGTGSAVLVSGQAGIYQVTFNVPANPPTGNSSLAVTIGGVKVTA